MRGSSSAEAPAWWELSLDWPVEHVPCELEVVEPRRLTALEWAILKVLEVFKDAPPSIEETVQELGLGKPEFLQDTLRALISLKALVPRPGVENPTQLSEVAFTDRGLELFRRGQVDAEPSHPGYQLYFDALTDEALPSPARNGPPTRPIVDPSTLAQPREEVGLERVRAIVHQFGPPVGGADAHIRASRVLAPDEAVNLHSGHRWITHSIGLAPTPDGRLALRTPSLTAGQRLWLAGQTLRNWVDPSRAVTFSWTEVPSFRRSRQSLGAWQKAVERLVPISRVPEEARRLIGQAKREVLLHAAWAAAPEVRDALSAAARRGVAIYVLGAPSTQIVEWSMAPQRRPGFIVEAGHAGTAAASLVVDRSEALLLDEVLAEVEESERHGFEVVGWTRTQAAALGLELHESLLGVLPLLEPGTPAPFEVRRGQRVDVAVNRLLGDAHLQLALARLTLTSGKETWDRVQTWISSRCAGADRVAAIYQVADMAGRLATDGSPAPWQSAGAATWEGFFAAIRAESPEAVPDDVLRELVLLAPPGAPPEVILDPLVERWVPPAPATQAPGPLRQLSRLRQLVEARWHGETASNCRGFQATLHRCLQVIAPLPDTPALTELISLVERTAPAAKARAWGEAVADLWPTPLHCSQFKAWCQRHEILRRLLGPVLLPRLVERWKALILATPARKPEQMVEQLRAIYGLLSPSEATEHMLAVPVPGSRVESAERIVQLSTACRAVWGQEAPKDETWSRSLQKLLTVPPQGYAPEEHAPLLVELQRRLQGWPGGLTVLRAWARGLAETIPPPVRAEGFTWWLGTLRDFTRILDAQTLQSVASGGLRRHQGPLREARRQSASLWTETVEAWRALGLAQATLEAMIEPPRTADSPQGKKPKNGGKKR